MVFFIGNSFSEVDFYGDEWASVDAAIIHLADTIDRLNLLQICVDELLQIDPDSNSIIEKEHLPALIDIFNQIISLPSLERYTSCDVSDLKEELSDFIEIAKKALIQGKGLVCSGD